MKVDWLVVGAGLTGATFAERIANQRGESVLVVDQRDHVGGNTWDEYNEQGILLHKYGPHIFHTNSKEVWSYLSQFTEWRPYSHRVLAVIDGNLVPLPFNINSIERLFPAHLAGRLSEKLVNNYGMGSRVPILKLRQAPDDDLRFLADFIYSKVFENYTRKQWDLSPEELLPSVTARIPVLVSRDDRYFQDRYQGMPLTGYGAMVRRMLEHPSIRIMLKTRWEDIKKDVSYRRMVFTGPIDEYFEFRHGALPYRSLRFDVQTHAVERYQTAAVVNYPNDYDYTRVTEQKWLTGQEHRHTTILTEFPIAHIPGETVPYYPVPTEANMAQFKRYEADASELSGRVTFAGRLGDYMYYNMDQAVARGLMLVRNLG